MNSEALQIVKAYEELNIGPSDIAEARELDVVEVKMVLAQHSVQYRKDVGKEEKSGKKQIGFTDEQHEMAVEAIFGTMLSTDDDNLKTRLAKYIREDKTGRRDVHLKNLKKLNINVAVFNQQMQRANASLERSKEKKLSNAHHDDIIPGSVMTTRSPIGVDESLSTNVSPTQALNSPLVSESQPILEAEEIKQ